MLDVTKEDVQLVEWNVNSCFGHTDNAADLDIYRILIWVTYAQADASACTYIYTQPTMNDSNLCVNSKDIVCSRSVGHREAYKVHASVGYRFQRASKDCLDILAQYSAIGTVVFHGRRRSCVECLFRDLHRRLVLSVNAKSTMRLAAVAATDHCAAFLL